MKLAKPLIVFLALMAPAAISVFAQELRHEAPSGFPAVKIVPGTIQVHPVNVLSADESVRQATIAQSQEKRQRGWVEAPPGRHDSFLAYFQENSSGPKQMRSSLDELAGKLRVAPANLQGTLLDGFKLYGAWWAGGFVNGGWTGVVRSGTTPKLGRVVLEEYDYAQAGSFFMIPEELVDFNANGLPGQFIVFRDASGPSWSEMRWFTANKEFRLRIDQPILKSDSMYQALQELATQLR